MIKNHQFILFALVGIAGFVVDAGILYVVLKIGLGYFAGRAVSFTCAVLTTWLINRKTTFAHRPDQPLAEEATRYLIAMSLGGVVNYGVYSLVIIEFHNSAYIAFCAVAAGSIAGLFFNFLSAKTWVYKH